MDWHEHSVELLIQFWNVDGLSASQTAVALAKATGGRFTRNSVLGKVHRLQLKGRRVAKRTKPTHKPNPKSARSDEGCKVVERAALPPHIEMDPSIHRGTFDGLSPNSPRESWHGARYWQKSMKSLSQPGTTGDTAAIARASTEAKLAFEAMTKDEDRDNLTAILDLDRTTCKWPIGDPVRGFCGHQPQAGSVYCQAHHERAYVPIRPRPKRGHNYSAKRGAFA